MELTDAEIIKIYGENSLPGFYYGRLIPHGPFLEEWKPINFLKGYEISNYGRFKNIKSKKPRNPVTSFGYLRTSISNRGGKCWNVVIHRLVAIAFIENPEKKTTVNHIRGFKKDNLFTQLEWSTISENTLHGFRHLGRVRTNRKKIIGTHIVTNDKIYFKSLADAEKSGFLRFRIRACINKKIIQHKKYKWEYENK